MRTLRTSFVTCVVLSCFAPAMGAYVAYEGEVFPEEGGWTAGPNGDDPSVYTRSIRDGVFIIDATAQGGATVSYERRIGLSSDDVYYEWRAATSNNDGGSGIGFILEGPAVYSQVLVSWTADFAWVLLDADTLTPGWDYTQYHLVPGAFHTFRIVAQGALHNVYIDGVPVASASLQSPSGTEARIQFGFTKSLANTGTQSTWDYIRIGPAPEPSSALFSALGGASLVLSRRRRSERA
jgi:hypothetical protein